MKYKQRKPTSSPPLNLDLDVDLAGSHIDLKQTLRLKFNSPASSSRSTVDIAIYSIGTVRLVPVRLAFDQGSGPSFLTSSSGLGLGPGSGSTSTGPANATTIKPPTSISSEMETGMKLNSGTWPSPYPSSSERPGLDGSPCPRSPPGFNPPSPPPLPKSNNVLAAGYRKVRWTYWKWTGCGWTGG
jgi:hypothetical protein